MNYLTEEDLRKHAKIHIHERAALPKHVEVMGELPKTAVGKIFKPDLRKAAIMRIYNAALEEAGVAARVVSVLDDKKRGLIAELESNGTPEEEVSKVLGSFTRPWEWLKDHVDA